MDFCLGVTCLVELDITRKENLRPTCTLEFAQLTLNFGADNFRWSLRSLPTLDYLPVLSPTLFLEEDFSTVLF